MHIQCTPPRPQSQPKRKKGSFEILGCDIMFDCNLKPYLIEINIVPSFALDTVT